MNALDELLSPENFPPCDPVRGEAVRELADLRAALADIASVSKVELIGGAYMLGVRACDGWNYVAIKPATAAALAPRAAAKEARDDG